MKTKICSGNSENEGSENARLTLLSFWAPSMGVRTKKSFVQSLVRYERASMDAKLFRRFVESGGFRKRIRVLRRVGYNHLISNKREWNNCFIKNAPKISDKSSQLYFVRRNRMGNVEIIFKCVNCPNLRCFALTNTDA